MWKEETLYIQSPNSKQSQTPTINKKEKQVLTSKVFKLKRKTEKENKNKNKNKNKIK